MSTTLTSTIERTGEYRIVETPTYEGMFYTIERDGQPLTAADGTIRRFATRNSARKRITRERRGDFHR